MQYELLDFGDGRKLERFGDYILDRPAPGAAAYRKQRPELWILAQTQFIREANLQGTWRDKTPFPESWTIRVGELVFQLKRTPVGHLGVFIEQADNWNWLRCQTRQNMKVLNLFAYTGGSTMAAASSDPSVTVSHIDSAANTVQWARQNAELTESKIGRTMAIRWICEDAQRFVSREIKRGNRYDAIILDPPSYGHGAKSEVWKIAEALPQLLDDCMELTGGAPRYVLLTAHTPEFPAEELASLLRSRLTGEYQYQLGSMKPYSPAINPFPCGDFVRVAKME